MIDAYEIHEYDDPNAKVIANLSKVEYEALTEYINILKTSQPKIELGVVYGWSFLDFSIFYKIEIEPKINDISNRLKKLNGIENRIFTSFDSTDPLSDMLSNNDIRNYISEILRRNSNGT